MRQILSLDVKWCFLSIPRNNLPHIQCTRILTVASDYKGKASETYQIIEFSLNLYKMPFSSLIFPVYGNDQERNILLPDMHTTTRYTHGGTPPFLQLECYSSGISVLMKKEVKYLRKEK